MNEHEIQQAVEALTQRARGFHSPSSYSQPWALARVYRHSVMVKVHELGFSCEAEGATFAECFARCHEILDDNDPALLARTLGIEECAA